MAGTSAKPVDTLWTLKDQHRLAQDILQNNSEKIGNISLSKKYEALLRMLELLVNPVQVAEMERILIENGLMDEANRRCAILTNHLVPRKMLEEEQVKSRTYYNLIQNLIAEKQELQDQLLRARGVKRALGDEKW